MILNCSYSAGSQSSGINSQYVKTVFGIDDSQSKNIICNGVKIEYEPGRIVLFTGPSGSGKSSLLKKANRKIKKSVLLQEEQKSCKAIVDQLYDDPELSVKLLSLCGLADATILLRSPSRLSDGQRYRFALASAIAQGSDYIFADEWCAKLDRVTAKVISRNVRRISDRENRGFFLATCNEDIIDDLNPNTIVYCRGGGIVEVENNRRAGVNDSPDCFRETISLLDGLEVTEGSIKDWPYFARWHYRGYGLGPIRKIFLLWDCNEPIGICIFGFGPLSSSNRNRIFALPGKLNRDRADYINRNFVSVVRFVIDPRYRGASVASRFLRRCCDLVSWPWIELVSEMANLVPFCQSAGFVRVPPDESELPLLSQNTKAGQTHYGKSNWSETGFKKYLQKTRFSKPGYFLYDNRIKQNETQGL